MFFEPIIYGSMSYLLGVIINALVFFWCYREFKGGRLSKVQYVLSAVFSLALSYLLWAWIFPRLGFLIFGI